MIDYAAALDTACKYYDKVRLNYMFKHEDAVKELASHGLFTPFEVAKIVGCSVGFASKHMDTHGSGKAGAGWTQRKWGVEALSTLWLIALDYGADDKHVNKILIQKAARAGTSVKAIHQLTGVPLDDVRRAVYGDPNLLDILRTGTDTASRRSHFKN